MSSNSQKGSTSRSSGAVPSVQLELWINGTPYSLGVDVRTTLLDLLRERLAMSGTKKGCDHGLCGACTVFVDGERVVSCLTLAASISGSKVVTIEGVADGTRLTPLQEAFLAHDGFQCGYCTPGQIISAHAMLAEHARGDLSTVSFEASHEPVLSEQPELTESEVRERMAGNICRCGAYANIVAAILSVDQKDKG